MTRCFIGVCTVLLGLACGLPALAQESPTALEKETDKLLGKVSCEVISEEIIPLVPPNFEGAALWKRVVGVEGKDRPRDLMPLADGGSVMVGETIPFDRQKGESPALLHLLRLDKGGVVKVETRTPIKNLSSVAAGGVLKDRIVVLSHIKPSEKEDEMLLTFFDGAGSLKTTVPLRDPKVRLVPKDMVVEAGAKSMLIAAEAIHPKNDEDHYSLLIRVDETGKELSRKEYLPGVPNRIESLKRLAGGQILALGRVESERGRESGWILRVARPGDILQQRAYPRGAEALLRRAAVLPEGSLVVVGDSIPSQDGARAAWVMKLSPSGEPLWQKYITGKYSYAGLDVAVLPDGRITALLGGRPDGSGGRQYARIVTFTQLGQMVADESYIEGNNTLPEKMLVSGSDRLLIGMAETGFSKYAQGDENRLQTYDSLVLKMTPLPVFTDSCAKGAREKLDDLP
jgi:hypothetical protein